MTQQINRLGQFATNGQSGGLADPLTQNMMHTAVENAGRAFGERLKQFMDPRRDINDECGYPDTTSITLEDYRDFYDRESVATRVVDVLPMESWQVQPTIFETEEVDAETEFEKAWKELGKSLAGVSWFKDEEGSPIWEYLLRIDKLSGIGSFGVLLLGLNDGGDLREPVPGMTFTGGVTVGTPGTRRTTNRKLLFLRAVDESLVNISRYEDNELNPRFGQPTEYSVTLNDLSATPSRTGIGARQKTARVHWSRVIHVADNLMRGGNEIFGIPRMLPVFNRLYDLKKIYAADGETYWKNAMLKLFFESHPQLGGDVEIDTVGFRDSIEQMMNGLQQWMVTSGMSVNAIAPAVSDPTAHIGVQLEAICIKLGIPKRIFTGSERGELASNQDDSTWNDRLRARQRDYITPRIIVPFVNRLIAVGVLPTPESYSVVWPDLETIDDVTQADVALKRAQAFAAYIQGGVEQIIPPMQFLVKEMNYEPDEAKEVLESAVEAIEAEEDMTGVGTDEEAEAEMADMQAKLDKSEQKQMVAVAPVGNESLEDDIENLAREFNLDPAEVAIGKAQYLEGLENG